MVDRYRSLGARMLKEPHGAYVAHEDYQRLEAELSTERDIGNDLFISNQTLRARVAELEDEINNPKMTYCVYCGKEFDIGDRDEATKLVVEHIYTCEKHPLSSYITRVAELEDLLQQHQTYQTKQGDKAALAAVEGK